MRRKAQSIATSLKFYGAWSIDMYRKDSRKDSFMLPVTTTGVGPELLSSKFLNFYEKKQSWQDEWLCYIES